MPAKPIKNSSRRSFLKSAAGAGGAVAAASLLATEVSADQPEADVVDATLNESVGYHETPHIREYYEKARF